MRAREFLLLPMLRSMLRSMLRPRLRFAPLHGFALDAPSASLRSAGCASRLRPCFAHDAPSSSLRSAGCASRLRSMLRP
jgi:hypothetical protein